MYSMRKEDKNKVEEQVFKLKLRDKKDKFAGSLEFKLLKMSRGWDYQWWWPLTFGPWSKLGSVVKEIEDELCMTDNKTLQNKLKAYKLELKGK